MARSSRTQKCKKRRQPRYEVSNNIQCPAMVRASEWDRMLNCNSDMFMIFHADSRNAGMENPCEFHEQQRNIAVRNNKNQGMPETSHFNHNGPRLLPFG